MKKQGIVNGTHTYSEEENYIPPESPEVQEHLKWFMGRKLGLMMHWSPDCQLGVGISWPLCDASRSWSQRDIDWTDDIEEFKDQYWNLYRTFNPVRFRPDKWAKLAKECGFQYLLFTTKHHDGFCMFDTKTTDFKITNPDCPFSKNKRANIVKEMFDAFRAEGLAISAYFSKPDWHSDAYWHRAFGVSPSTTDTNYDIKEHPELWEEFVQYVHQQLRELTSEYGKIDVLWLDGGCVRPDRRGQDVRIGEIVEEIRATTQPHLIACDRTVGGPYENIITPEQEIPDHPIHIPWEACITLGSRFTFQYDDVDFKPARELVKMFVDIISKGGCLALNVTPRPDGELPRGMVHRMCQFGGWIQLNREGIFDTGISAYVPNRNLRFTSKGDTDYCFYLYDEIPFLQPHVVLTAPYTVKEVRLLRTGQALPFTQKGKELDIDTSSVSMMGAEYADCFALKHYSADI